MNRTVDVAVVGAGVVGCAVAYYLAREGLKVCILDRNAIGGGATAHATGSLAMVGTDFSQGPPFLLGLESVRATKDLVAELHERTGMDTLYQARPGLRLALDESEEALTKGLLEWMTDHLPLTWISGEEVRKIEPRLSPAVRGAAYVNETAQLDSYRFTLAMAHGMEKLGGEVLLREVTGLEHNGDRVTAVEYGSGKVACSDAVLAMGPWSKAASAWLNFHVPVAPFKGERLLLRYEGKPLPVIVGSPKRGHMLTRRDGYWSVGSTGGRDFDGRAGFELGQEERWSFDDQPTEAAKFELLQRAMDVLPDLERAQMVQQLAGVRPLSSDMLPLIGKVPGWRGVWLATGHGTKGIHLAAITGWIIADLITRGKTEVPVPLEPFAPTRFDE